MVFPHGVLDLETQISVSVWHQPKLDKIWRFSFFLLVEHANMTLESSYTDNFGAATAI